MIEDQAHADINRRWESMDPWSAFQLSQNLAEMMAGAE